MTLIWRRWGVQTGSSGLFCSDLVSSRGPFGKMSFRWTFIPLTPLRTISGDLLYHLRTHFHAEAHTTHRLTRSIFQVLLQQSSRQLLQSGLNPRSDFHSASVYRHVKTLTFGHLSSIHLRPPAVFQCNVCRRHIVGGTCCWEAAISRLPCRRAHSASVSQL